MKTDVDKLILAKIAISNRALSEYATSIFVKCYSSVIEMKVCNVGNNQEKLRLLSNQIKIQIP